jgi:hypothetical protein
VINRTELSSPITKLGINLCYISSFSFVNEAFQVSMASESEDSVRHSDESSVASSPVVSFSDSVAPSG